MPKFTALQTMVDKLNLVTREILTGIPVIRAFSREKHEEERFEDANITLMKTNLFVNRCMTFMMPVMMLIMNAVSAIKKRKRHIICRLRLFIARTASVNPYSPINQLYISSY